MRVLMITQRVDADHDILGFVVEWIETLAKQDEINHLDVLTGFEGRHDLPYNVHIRSYGKDRDYPKWRRVLEFERLCAHYALIGVDVVFAHMIPKYVLAAWPWLRPTGTRFVLWYAHSSVEWDLRIAHELVDRVVTPTEQSFRLPSEKLRIVGHGIDTDRFTPEGRSDRSLLLGVGRIDPIKRFEVLIDAVAHLSDRNHDVQLRIVGEPSGDGSYLSNLRDRIASRGVDNIVKFVGRVPHSEILDEYRRAGVFLNASKTGSLDKTEIEAMACETPVISSNDSYVEMVQEVGLNGEILSFNPDNAEELATNIETILEMDATTYQDICHESRKLARCRHDLSAQMGRIAAQLAAVRDGKPLT